MFDIRKIQEKALLDAVTDVAGEDTANSVVYGDRAQSEDNAAWVHSTMRRLEKQFDRAIIKRIRMNCQCGYAMDEKLALVKDLMASSSCLEEFANQGRARAAGLSCIDQALYLQFQSCPCPMLAAVDRLETDSWCQCTTGYSKVLFEKAFGCEVEVELLQSIKTGHDSCLMKIVPAGAVKWDKAPRT